MITQNLLQENNIEFLKNHNFCEQFAPTVLNYASKYREFSKDKFSVIMMYDGNMYLHKRLSIGFSYEYLGEVSQAEIKEFI